MSRQRKIQPSQPAPEQGAGCFSGALLIPALVLLVIVLLGGLAWKAPLPPAALPSAALSPIFRPEVAYWAPAIVRWAARFNLDSNLVATVMQIESCGDPAALSSAGAIGLFQVMPFHFEPGEDAYAPETNAARGLAYLAQALSRGAGSPRLALAGYNGGLGVIQAGEGSWHAQTRRYVQYGVPIYEDALNKKSSSAALEDWYQHYGVSLCAHAHQRLGLP